MMALLSFRKTIWTYWFHVSLFSISLRFFFLQAQWSEKLESLKGEKKTKKKEHRENKDEWMNRLEM